jgi:hypothetical protein
VCRSLTVDYFKTRYFTFLRRLKGGLGLETLDIVVQGAEELEGLSNPTEEVLKIVRTVRKVAEEISPPPASPSSVSPLHPAPARVTPPLPIPPPSPLATASAAPSPNPLKRKRVEDQDLKDELHSVLEELATTKQQLSSLNEQYEHLKVFSSANYELLCHAHKKLRSAEELLQDRSTAYDLMEDYNSVLHKELTVTKYQLEIKQERFKTLTEILIQQIKNL